MSPIVAKCQQCSKPIAVGDRHAVCAFAIAEHHGFKPKSVTVICNDCITVAFAALQARAPRVTDS